MLRDLKDRFLALPWVYDTLRPLAIGLISYEEIARFSRVDETDRVLDLGCGTGQLVPFLRCCEYLGVDTDGSALARARRFSGPNIRFIEGDSWDEECRKLNPTVVLMIGLVHHVPDDTFRSVVRRFKETAHALCRIVTFDTTFLPGHPFNNLLSRMDRGRYVREPLAYEHLFQSSGLRVLRKEVLPTRLRFAVYIGYHLALDGAAVNHAAFNSPLGF